METRRVALQVIGYLNDVLRDRTLPGPALEFAERLLETVLKQVREEEIL